MNHLKWFHFTTSTWGCAAMPLASTSTSNSSVCLSCIEALLVSPFARVITSHSQKLNHEVMNVTTTTTHFPQRGLNLKSCVLPISLQEPLKHL